jgi:hypothetical protein
MQRWLFGALALVYPWLAPAQVAVLQMQVVEGEGTVHTAGSRNRQPVSVAITDETGRPAAGATVSFTLPAEGPSGTFPNGLRTEILTTDTLGRATVRSFRLNRIPGRFQMRITASKEQARAGMVSFQYVAGLDNGKPAATAKAKSGKTLLLLALAAGAAATGIGVAMAGGGHGPAPSPPPAALAAAPVQVLTIGAPTITVGKP